MDDLEGNENEVCVRRVSFVEIVRKLSALRGCTLNWQVKLAPFSPLFHYLVKKKKLKNPNKLNLLSVIWFEMNVMVTVPVDVSCFCCCLKSSTASMLFLSPFISCLNVFFERNTFVFNLRNIIVVPVLVELNQQITPCLHAFIYWIVEFSLMEHNLIGGLILLLS